MRKEATVEIFALCEDGLVRLREDGQRWRAERLFETSHARALAIDPRDPRVLLIGTRGDGAWRSTDGGETWSPLDLSCDDVFSLAISPVDGRIYAGCEPSQLHVSDDGGTTWRERTSLRSIPSSPEWSFPPRPWTSHVRAIAPHPREADLLLLGIELGGLMRSTDGGVTWLDHRPDAQRDVHALAWHPSGDGRAFEAGGGGTARSDDHGDSWERVDEGRELPYCWALAVAPGEDETWFASAAAGPRHAHGDRPARAGLYRRRGGTPWQRIEQGLPSPLDDMPYALAASRDRVWVGLRSGRIFVSDDLGDGWRELDIVGAALQVPRVLVVVDRERRASADR